MRPLPLPWIETLWSQLIVVYGVEFLRQYEHVKLPPVKADWCEKLAWTLTKPDETEAQRACPAIAWALDNLAVGKPPNVLEFRQLCRGYHAPEPIALPMEPRAAPARLRRVLEQLAKPLEDQRPGQVRAAERYIARHADKPRHSPVEVDFLTFYAGVLERWNADQPKEATNAVIDH